MTARSLFSQARCIRMTRSRSRVIARSSARIGDGVDNGRQCWCSWRKVSASTKASNVSDFVAASR